MKKEILKSINRKMTTKDIALETECSIRKAERIKNDIKKTFNIEIVLRKHYDLYFLLY